MQNYYITSLNHQALLAVAEALRNGDSQLLNQLGLGAIDQSVASQLKALSADRIACLPNFKGSLFQLRIDPHTLRLYLGFADSKVTEDDLVNRAIRAGLRQPMLEELKGISRRDFAARRSRMSLPEHSRGRIEVLSEEEELTVLRAWEKLRDIEDPLERLIALHQETDIALDQAYITIKQLQ
ncbi:STY4526/YPO1902 family pathogenicity island replication protein [Cellvibrio sp. KY-GH-1]|uniref:STY4526/YPO1902 family pathogenicity island replication protein n=1 Tax=Cellvibrio sp. KY-GH-1 TaxID=2303332 RepID=UPI00177C7A22|nr:STY4526/YPO1902 family pathogenicity island replication protein [Cellvibrio sp. KY-GH-1]